MISLSILIPIYLIFVAIFFIFLAINIYHIAMSAAMSATSFLVTFFISAAGILTIYVTWALLRSIDFSQPIIDLGTRNLF